MKDNWEHGNFIDFIDKIVGGGTPSRKNIDYWRGNIPWASVKDFKDGSTKLLDTEEKITELGLRYSASNLIASGVPIMCTRMAVGRCAVSNIPIAINQDLKAIFPNDKLDAQFLLLLLSYFERDFLNLAIGSTVKGITLSSLKSFKLSIPKSLPHQQKIAKILSTCDAVIEKTEAAIEKYKALKQGMMHDLFTRGIDVETGKLRPSPQDAPELYKNSVLGMIPKEWEVKRLEDVANLIDGDRGVNYPSEGSFSEEGYCLFLSAKNVTKNGFQFLERQFISQEIDAKMNNGKLQLNDILITTRGTVGNIAIYDSNFEYKNIRINSGMLIIRKTNYQLDNLCFYHFFKSNFFKSQLDRVLSGSAQPQITVKNMNEFVVPFLHSLDEQKEITKRLNTIDQKLSLEQGVLLKYRQIKLGLMQDLLTGVVEV